MFFTPLLKLYIFRICLAFCHYCPATYLNFHLYHIISLLRPPAFHQKHSSTSHTVGMMPVKNPSYLVLRYSCLFNLSRALCYWCMDYCYCISWLWYTLDQCIWWYYIYPPAVSFTGPFPACVACEKWHWLRMLGTICMSEWELLAVIARHHAISRSW